jgi:hypothetical protein
VLIAIVLLGGVVGGTMATLRATILGGAVHRDHAKAHAWLQTSSDILYASPKEYCNTIDPDGGENTVRTKYEEIITGVETPEGWDGWQISVVAPVQFWNAGNVDADPDIDLYFGSACDPNLELQLIELQVRAPNGRVIESVEIVK